MHADERPIQALQQLETGHLRPFLRQVGDKLLCALTFGCYCIDEVDKIATEMSPLGHAGKVSLPFHGNVEPGELGALLETGEMAGSRILQNQPGIPVSAQVDREIESIWFKALHEPPEIVIAEGFVSREGSLLKKIECDKLVNFGHQGPDRLRPGSAEHVDQSMGEYLPESADCRNRADAIADMVELDDKDLAYRLAGKKGPADAKNLYRLGFWNNIVNLL